MTYTVQTCMSALPLQCEVRGFAKKEKTLKIRDYYGSGWVGPDLTRNFSFLENHPKIALNLY